LSRIRDVRWNVVERPGHVAVGRAWFQDDRLRFYERAEECWAEARPYEMLNHLVSFPCNHLLIDRVTIWEGQTDRLCFETVPSEIYPGNYPTLGGAVRGLMP
jgi:hypothetical protein